MTELQNGPGRAGVFGGSFDPIHNGHLKIAEAALRRHGLDGVIFVPARHQPQKPNAPAAPGEHRLAMIKLAIREHAAFSVSDCELKRPGRSFTIDTIRELRGPLGPETELFFILGSDSVHELPGWRDLRGLTELCTLVVAARPGWSLDALDALEGQLSADRLATMKTGAIHCTSNAVSSSDIRELIASGQSIAGLVPDAVAEYIAENKLYRST